MSEVTLALSELAGRLDISVSAADSPQSIADKIFDGQKPVELSLSETEGRLMLDNRTLKLANLTAKGLAPAIGNRLSMAFCSDDLALSLDPDMFDLVCSVVESTLEQRILNLAENSGAQAELLKEKPKAETMSDRAKKLNPV
jgi:hypothetical protein